MGNYLNADISGFPHLNRPRDVDFESLGMVLRRIQNGFYRQVVTSVRTLKPPPGTDKASPAYKAYTAAKDRLPSFTPCCALKHRAKDVPMAEKLLSCTGLVHLDYDDLDDAGGFKARLAQHPALVFAFVSPSGVGLKVGIAANGITDEATYKAVWRAVVSQLHQEYPGYLPSQDESIKYLNALCFVSDDPDIYLNGDAIPLALPLTSSAPAAPAAPADPPTPAPTGGDPDYATMYKALATYPGYDDYKEWIAVGQHLHDSGQPWARTLWDTWSQQSAKYDAQTQEKKWTGFHRGGGRTLQGLLRRIEALQRTNGITSYNGTNYLAEKSGHLPQQNSGEEGGQVFTSLTSSPNAMEWPTIADEAFTGLAGDFVRALSPHSEADPIALLVQLLSYFGAVVGRSAFHWVEEATQHYTNTSICLVGASSRARKGTAYDHIERVFHEIDPSWSSHNVIGGCGSGEGVIAAVRDPVFKHEAIRENKRVVGYEDVEVDPGVTDKRLLIYEAEFSSVLKVAGRDHNLLSEVLRKAWESGHLHNNVKTSPLHATHAHISMIGHITLDELQRTLTTTEAANGFANRILWVCVRRSKLLPDGGQLHTVDLKPLKDRLNTAVSSSKSISMMSRDVMASTAWHAVYGALTEDRPGMVGTLLARAEAQVLRLSMLYALLDGSAVITHPHLNAALALWQYVEASIQYIFGSTLGDATADTLLAALDQAPHGLSRNHLLTQTLHGNTRADELDRVLRLLLKRQLIQITKHAPPGRGRPTEVIQRTGYEVNGVNTPNYVSMSNDAVKCQELPRNGGQKNYEVIPIEAENPPGVESIIIGEPAPVTPASADPVPAFTALVASELWCADCRQSQTVTLVAGEYICTECGQVLGAWQSSEDEAADLDYEVGEL